jgi:hypothetical protein
MRHDTDSDLVSSIYRPLWLTYGLVPLIAGLDKFFNLLTDWPRYLSPQAIDLLPIAPQEFMYIVGVVEMIVGLMVLTWWPKVGAWIASVWLLAIAVNLVALGAYDIAVRDVAMSVGAMTLARVAAWREHAVPSHGRMVATH